jgi:hypothetical protein
MHMFTIDFLNVLHMYLKNGKVFSVAKANE